MIGKFISDFKALKNTIDIFEFFLLIFSKNRRKSKLFGRKILITDSFWFRHSLKEIFSEEVYRFDSDNESPYIIDCGSNIGMSIIYFKRIYPKARIIGFEPDQNICAKSLYNLKQFEISDVKIFQKAVWTKTSNLIFSQKGSLSGHIVEKQDDKSINVESTRLRDLLHEKVDFLKIDIEGPEYEIIKDCSDKLCNVENIFVEYHSFAENQQMIGELLIILKNAGFKLYLKEAWENMKHPFIEKKGPYFDLQLNIFGYRR